MVDCKLRILKVGYGYKNFKDYLSSLEWECVSLEFKIWQILAIKLVVALGYNLNKIKIATYFKNLTLNCMFFTFLIHMSNFVPIGYIYYDL